MATLLPLSFAQASWSGRLRGTLFLVIPLLIVGIVLRLRQVAENGNNILKRMCK